MKNNHGDILHQFASGFLILIFALSTLNAQGFTSKFTLSNYTPYVKEPFILTLDIEQTDHDKVMLFNFSPKANKAYEFHRLDIKKKDDYHAAKIHYIYLIYPLKSGKIDLAFNLLQMVTTDEKVAFSFSGDRDNVRGLNKIDIPITLTPISINVKPLPQGTQLVGDFKLSYTLKNKKVKAYEPLPITLVLKGRGYPPLVNNIIPPSKKFSLFLGQPLQKIFKTPKGIEGSVTYSLALSAKESFTLPTITIKAFDPEKNRSYQLNIPKQDFNITQTDIKSLVDNIDSPQPLQSDWSWIGKVLGYIVAFVSGFLSAYFIKWRPKYQIMQTKDKFKTDVGACSSHKELLTLLLATDSNRYQNAIEELERSIYGKKRVSLERIKGLL